MWNSVRTIWEALAICVAVTVPAFGQGGDDAPAHRFYEIRVDLVSINPEAGISTYRVHGEGSVGGPGTLSHDVAYEERKFDVKVTPRIQNGRLFATVVVEPDPVDRLTQGVTKDVDLSEFQGESLELVRDPNGRVYRLNLFPAISDIPQPKQFQAADLRLENWTFPSCPVIVNDQEYVGSLAVGTSPVAWFDALNVGLVEFSLLHLKDAQPWGTLKDGVINIRHEDGRTISIRGVQNGFPRETLAGGPYTVWVRWKPSTATLEDYRQGLRKSIEQLTARIENGDTSVDPQSLERLKSMIETDHPRLVRNGLRGVRPGELVPDDH